MTPAEALRAACEAEDEAAVRALLIDLPESERAGLAPVARDIAAIQVKRGIDAAAHLGPMLLAAYGVLGVSEIRKLAWRAGHIPRHLDDVLRRRAPERLAPIVAFLLDEVGGGHAWRTVRPLVRAGVVPRPDRPSYTIAMLAGTGYRSVAELLADDPGLLEDEVWRLFEVEGGGETSLANHEKFSRDLWGHTFRELASTDPAMRQRLLDVSLSALARDFGAYRAGWFSRFHESLAPTDDERAQRVDAYLALLRSRVGPTVSFAVAALVKVDRAGRLAPELLLTRIGPVLLEGSTGTAKAALALVGHAGSGSPDRAHAAAAVAADALGNPSPDVQRMAVALIEKLVDVPNERVARAVADRLPGIAASQRTATTALAARLGGPDAPAAEGSTPAALVADGPTPVTDGSGRVSPGRPSPIDPDRAIEPLASIEALVDVAVTVLEEGGPADDIERVLDGVGRLAGDRSEGFVRLTAPLARRARTILAGRDRYPFCGVDPRADVAAVLLAWATGEVVEPGRIHASVDPGAGAFLSGRARELAEVVAGGRSFVGIAAPTHRGGWIDPVVLVERLMARAPASALDLVAAVLRLAPDGRRAARAMASGVAGEAGAVVRYALGGEEGIGVTAAWWVAAARVRAPGRDDPSVEARHPRLGPDAGLAAHARLVEAKPDIGRYYAGLGLDVEPPPTKATSVALPTVLMLHDPSSFFWSGRSDPSMFRWMATIQPGYREAWSAVGGLLMARNVDWWSAEWANRAFLEPFIDPATSIGAHSRFLLGVALGAKEAGERGLATDVVRLALGDGRLTAADLAQGLSAAAAIARDRPNRWSASLSDVTIGSDMHSNAVARAVATILPVLAERPPAKLVPLLRLLDELLAGSGGPIDDAARPTLEQLSGSGGHAGRLSKSILSHG